MPSYIDSGQIWLACHQVWSSLANGDLPRVQCWSVLVVSSLNGRSQLRGKATSLNPCTGFIPAPSIECFLSGLISAAVGGWGKGTSVQEKEHLIHVWNGCPLMGILWNMSIFTCSTHSEKSIHTILSKTSLSPIFQLYYFQVPDHQPAL